ncbi:MAG: hypothetical protein AAGN66_16655 [Acidobacteriota bacterium]
MTKDPGRPPDPPDRDGARGASGVESAEQTVRGLLGGLGRITARLGEVAELAGEAVAEAEQRRREGGPGDSKAVYDVSFRVGLGEAGARSAGPGGRGGAQGPPTPRGGGPSPRPPQTRKARAGAPADGPVREPYAEVARDGELCVVLFDMPGVEASGVEVCLREHGIEVLGHGGGRRWGKTMEIDNLPESPELELSAKNGIVRLEIRPAADG